MSKQYTVQAPDGHMVTLEGPEGASEEDVIRQAQALYKPAPDAATLAARKAETLQQSRDQMVPWYTGLFNRGNPSSPTSQGLEKAADLTSQVAPGAAEAVTGIPSAIAGAAQMVTQPRLIPGALKSMANPITTPVKQAIELAKPGLVNAPTPDAPETTAAARGAGTMLGSAVLAGGAELAGPTIRNAFDQVKAKFQSPGLDAAAVNKWMDVPAKQVARGANPGQQLLDDNLIGATKEATKANVDSALTSAGKDIETHLKAADAQGVKIDAEHLVKDALDSAEAKLKSPTDAAFGNRVKSTFDKILNRYPDIDDLTPSRAHALKVELGKNINWRLSADDPLNDAFIQAYGEVNSAIKGAVKGIGPAQSRWGNLNLASKNLAESLTEDVVGKGSGPGAPVPPSSPAAIFAKKAAKYAVPAGIAGKIYHDYGP